MLNSLDVAFMKLEAYTWIHFSTQFGVEASSAFSENSYFKCRGFLWIMGSIHAGLALDDA